MCWSFNILNVNLYFVWFGKGLLHTELAHYGLYKAHVAFLNVYSLHLVRYAVYLVRRVTLLSSKGLNETAYKFESYMFL